MEERWKPVVGFEDYFEVSNTGKIRSLNYKGRGTVHEMKQFKDESGYCQLVVHRYGKHTIMKMHRLVATAFIPNPEDLPLVMHLDDNPSNNLVSNLRWATVQENIDAKQHNKNPSKIRVLLTNSQRAELQALYATGKHTRLSLCSKFNVSRATVNVTLRGISNRGLK